MAQIKLVALDMDGTLLDNEKNISNYTKEVLEEAISHGIYIVPATGRIIKAVPDFLQSMEGIRYFLCCNGAAVYDKLKDEMVYTNYVSAKKTIEVFDCLKKYHCTRDIYQNGQGYMEEKYLNHLDEYKIKSHLHDLVLATRLPVEDLEKHISNRPDQIEKISAFFDVPKERLDALKKLEDLNIINPTASLPNNIEVMEIGCNKGDGLVHLAKHLHISMDQVMACGDAGNDKEMIEVAGIGVAMGNAHKEVKEIADYVTKTNEEDGVAYAIKKFVL